MLTGCAGWTHQEGSLCARAGLASPITSTGGESRPKPAAACVHGSPPPPEIVFERDPANAIGGTRGATDASIDPGCRSRSGPRQADRDGIVHAPAGCLDVRVSKASISRALHIMQAVVRAVEQRGYGIEVRDGKTWITVLGEPCPIFLKERLRQNIRDLTPDEHRQRREGLTVNPYTLIPNGELAFHIDDVYPRRSTSDTKSSASRILSTPSWRC